MSNLHDSLKSSLRAAALTVIGGLASSLAQAADTMDTAYWNMPKGVTDISQEVFKLHMAAFWVCIGIGVVVFGAMFYSVFAHRRSKHPVPATFHHSTLVEIIWTIIPFLILIGLAIPAAGTLIKEYDTRSADITVKITGYQWKWQYEYVGENVSFFSALEKKANKARQLRSGIDPRTVPNYLHDTDNYLVLPVGKKIRFLLTSNDVIHGWWMPDLAIKKDAIPGYINEMWTRINEPGIYRGQCTVLCGRDHGFMPIVVEAKSEADYAAWLAERKKAGGEVVAAAASATATDAAVAAPVVEAPAAPTEVAAAAEPKAAEAKTAAGGASKDDPIKAGMKVYATNCQVCHQATGAGLPPTFPALTGSKVATGPIAAHITQVLKGKNAMPPFAQLSDADIAAVVTFERNALGNKVGDAASAAQVKTLR